MPRKQKNIKLWMVTYNNPECVKNNLDTLFKSMEKFARVGREELDFQLQINIINNHSNFILPEDYQFEFKNIKVWNNLRIDESCGHLARDWNFALISSFRDLKAPACDQVICVHDDVIWHEDWFDKLWDIHYGQKFDFYIGDYGCSFHSYLPSAVRKVGLWDERFCNIAYHEADYMLRQRIYNPTNSTINDHVQGRVWNPTAVFFDHPHHNSDKQTAANESLRYHPVSRSVFEQKWGIYPERWGATNVLQSPPRGPLIPGYLYYPYFERDVETLTEQKYVQAWEFEQRWHQY